MFCLIGLHAWKDCVTDGNWTFQSCRVCDSRRIILRKELQGVNLHFGHHLPVVRDGWESGCTVEELKELLTIKPQFPRGTSSNFQPKNCEKVIVDLEKIQKNPVDRG